MAWAWSYVPPILPQEDYDDFYNEADGSALPSLVRPLLFTKSRVPIIDSATIDSPIVDSHFTPNCICAYYSLRKTRRRFRWVSMWIREL